MSIVDGPIHLQGRIQVLEVGDTFHVGPRVGRAARAASDIDGKQDQCQHSARDLDPGFFRNNAIKPGSDGRSATAALQQTVQMKAMDRLLGELQQVDGLAHGCQGQNRTTSRWGVLMLGFVLRLLIYTTLAFLAGCGSADVVGFQGSGAPPVASNAIQFRELGSTVSKAVDSSGGSLEAVLSDGTRFVLSIPPGAVSRSVDFTLTPVAVSGQLGLPVQMPLAVKITPSGTKFTGGAQLTITLPPHYDASTFRPYLMEDSGRPMFLLPSKRDGQNLTFRIDHLSVPGVSNSPVPIPPASAGVKEVESLAAQLAAVQFSNGSQSDIDNILQGYAEKLAQTGTSVAGHSSEQDCQAWVEEFSAYRSLLQFASPEAEQQIHQQLDPVAASVIRRGIELLGNKAVAGDDLQELKPITDFYLVEAQKADLDQVQFGLDGSTVRRELPIEFVFDQFEVDHSPLAEDDSAMVRFRVGYKLGSNPTHYDQSLVTQLGLTGGQLSSSEVATKGVVNGGIQVYNDVSLKPNSKEIQGQILVSFSNLQVGNGQIDNQDSLYRFTIPGKLKVTAAASGSDGGFTSIEVSVSQGTAKLPNTPVQLQVVRGGGNLSVPAATDDSGRLTASYSGGSGTNEIEVSVTEAGQQANTSLTFSYGQIPYPRLTALWKGAASNVQFTGNWTEELKTDWLLGSHSAGAQLSVERDLNLAPPSSLYPGETEGYGTFNFGFSDMLSQYSWAMATPVGGPVVVSRGAGIQTYKTTPVYVVSPGRLGYNSEYIYADRAGNTLIDIRDVVEFPERDVLPGSIDPQLNAKVILTYVVDNTQSFQNLTVSFELPVEHVTLREP